MVDLSVMSPLALAAAILPFTAACVDGRDATPTRSLAATADVRGREMQARFANTDVPAAVVAVVDREGYLQFESHGLLGGDPDRPVGPDSVFDIASMTKAVTSTAALQLVERGLVGLDEPLETILPALREIGITRKDGSIVAATRPLTLRDLLRHTAGFGYFFNSPVIMAQLQVDPTSGWPRPEEVAEGTYDWGFGVQPRRVFEAGERWHYGRNLGIVGRLVERLSGEDLDTYFKHHIFEPLGMDRTGYNLPSAVLEDRVPIAMRVPGTGTFLALQMPRAVPMERFYGGGELMSSPRDYARFLRCLLDGGELDGVRILGVEYTAMFMRDQLPAGLAIALDPMPGRPPAERSFTDDFDDGYSFAFAIEAGEPDGLRPPGVGYWSGIHNTYYTIDPTRGVAIMFFSQIQPFDDAEAYELYRTWEDLIYRDLR
ncbi:MAG: serine hydrolase domain-containing protein [Planctomycetota bacterium]|nr:serine hydrolase domain-containing protein [Planctomycetota bacterium]